MLQLTGCVNYTKERGLWAGKSLVLLAALMPLAKLAWLGMHDGLGANPIEMITRTTGYWTLTFLLITLRGVWQFESLFLWLMLISPWPAAQAETLRSQLETLAQENGIRIEGLDRLGTEPPRQAGGDVTQRIKSLLADYNFMLVGQSGKIERVAITSLKQLAPKPKNYGAVRTQRMGAHHQVQATLNGPNEIGIVVSLLIDTGATTLVLPESMMQRLGFNREALQDGFSQTAAGSVPVKTGMLRSVRVGDVSAENVPVSFISDQKLNGARLLGMSFLNRFRFSLDDENSELQLMQK
jgi:aspartyl protease family protein